PRSDQVEEDSMHPRKILYKVLLPSTEFEREAHWCDHAIRYVYYRDGELYRSGIRFHRVAAMRTRAERCCKAWHIDAYDMLVEVDDSPWVAEIRGDTQEIWRDTWQMR